MLHWVSCTMFVFSILFRSKRQLAVERKTKQPNNRQKKKNKKKIWNGIGPEHASTRENKNSERQIFVCNDENIHKQITTKEKQEQLETKYLRIQWQIG